MTDEEIQEALADRAADVARLLGEPEPPTEPEAAPAIVINIHIENLNISLETGQ